MSQGAGGGGDHHQPPEGGGSDRDGGARGEGGGGSGPPPGRGLEGFKLFIGGIPFKWDDRDLREYFMKLGNVTFSKV